MLTRLAQQQSRSKGNKKTREKKNAIEIKSYDGIDVCVHKIVERAAGEATTLHSLFPFIMWWPCIQQTTNRYIPNIKNLSRSNETAELSARVYVCVRYVHAYNLIT